MRRQSPPPPKGQGGNQRRPLRKEEGRKHHKGSHVLLYVTAACVCLFVLYGIVRLALLVVPIREIRVEQSGFYTDEELISALELAEGGRMFGFSVKKKEAAVTAQYPFIARVKVDRGLGGVLTVRVEEKAAECFVKVSGYYYVLGKEDFCVLLESETADRLKEYGLYEISLPSVRTAFLGEALEFGEKDDGAYVQVLLSTLENSFLNGRVTGIRASSAYRISVIVDGKYDVMLGSVSDLERKLERLGQMMESELFRGGSDVEVDLSVLSAPAAKRVERINDEIS